MKTANLEDLKAIAYETGRTLKELKDMAETNGWTVKDDTKPVQALTNTSDAVAMMRQIREQTIKDLYQNDPYIREHLNAQHAVEQANLNSAQHKDSNNNYDDAGNFTGIKKSILNGSNATVKNQVEAMRAIKADILKNLNIKDTV